MTMLPMDNNPLQLWNQGGSGLLNNMKQNNMSPAMMMANNPQFRQYLNPLMMMGRNPNNNDMNFLAGGMLGSVIPQMFGGNRGYGGGLMNLFNQGGGGYGGGGLFNLFSQGGGGYGGGGLMNLFNKGSSGGNGLFGGLLGSLIPQVVDQGTTNNSGDKPINIVTTPTSSSPRY